MSVDAFLARVDARPNGRDRWRCACPVCGERNRSTLSIGVGDTGAVLLRCWKSGCEPEQIAAAVGLEMSDLFPPRLSDGHASPPIQRRRWISASQALDLLEREALVLFVVGSDMVTGRSISEEDFGRLAEAVARVQALGAEVHA